MERFNSWMTHCQNRPAKSALPSHDLKWVTIAPACITSWVFNFPQLLQCSLPPNSFHVIAFSVLVDLWVTKIKKSLWSFARVVLRDHVNRARTADHAARTREKFVYSVVKVTRLYQPTPFFLEIHEVRKDLWAFFLDCTSVSSADWLGRHTPITWFAKQFKILKI